MRLKLLANSARVAGIRYRQGDEFEADGSDADRLVRIKAAADLDAVATPVKESPEEPVAEAPVDEPEKPEAPARPLNAANRAAWDAYAKKVGVDSSKYKTKEELIAALP